MNGLTDTSVSLKNIRIQGELAHVTFGFKGLGAAELTFTVFVAIPSLTSSADSLIREARKIVSTNLRTILDQLNSADDLPWRTQ